MSNKPQPDVDLMIRIRAKELGITLQQAYEIYASPFAFAKAKMQEANFDDPDSFKSIYIKGFGTIGPKKKQIESFKKGRERKKKRLAEENGTINNDKQ